MATEETKQRAHYYKRHIGDYKTDAGHLTMLKDGAYTRLLDLAYTMDGRLPADVNRIFDLTRAANRAEQKAVVEVLAEFFELRDGHYRHNRVDRELDAMRQVSQRRQDAAQARWGKRLDANALHLDSKCNAIHKPQATNQEPQSNNHGQTTADATQAGRACRLMCEAGCTRTNPAHPDLLQALAEGVTPEELATTALEGCEAGARNPFAWAIATARSRRSQTGGRSPRSTKVRHPLASARAVATGRYPRPPEAPDAPLTDAEVACG